MATQVSGRIRIGFFVGVLVPTSFILMSVGLRQNASGQSQPPRLNRSGVQTRVPRWYLASRYVQAASPRNDTENSGRIVFVARRMSSLAGLPVPSTDVVFIVTDRGELAQLTDSFESLKRVLRVHDWRRETYAGGQKLTGRWPDKGRVFRLDLIQVGKHALLGFGISRSREGGVLAGEYDRIRDSIRASLSSRSRPKKAGTAWQGIGRDLESLIAGTWVPNAYGDNLSDVYDRVRKSADEAESKVRAAKQSVESIEKSVAALSDIAESSKLLAGNTVENVAETAQKGDTSLKKGLKLAVGVIGLVKNAMSANIEGIFTSGQTIIDSIKKIRNQRKTDAAIIDSDRMLGAFQDAIDQLKDKRANFSTAVDNLQRAVDAYQNVMDAKAAIRNAWGNGPQIGADDVKKLQTQALSVATDSTPTVFREREIALDTAHSSSSVGGTDSESVAKVNGTCISPAAAQDLISRIQSIQLESEKIQSILGINDMAGTCFESVKVVQDLARRQAGYRTLVRSLAKQRKELYAAVRAEHLGGIAETVGLKVDASVALESSDNGDTVIQEYKKRILDEVDSGVRKRANQICVADVHCNDQKAECQQTDLYKLWKTSCSASANPRDDSKWSIFKKRKRQSVSAECGTDPCEKVTCSVADCERLIIVKAEDERIRALLKTKQDAEVALKKIEREDEFRRNADNRMLESIPVVNESADAYYSLLLDGLRSTMATLNVEYLTYNNEKMADAYSKVKVLCQKIENDQRTSGKRVNPEVTDKKMDMNSVLCVQFSRCEACAEIPETRPDYSTLEDGDCRKVNGKWVSVKK